PDLADHLADPDAAIVSVLPQEIQEGAHVSRYALGVTILATRLLSCVAAGDAAVLRRARAHAQKKKTASSAQGNRRARARSPRISSFRMFQSSRKSGDARLMRFTLSARFSKSKLDSGTR